MDDLKRSILVVITNVFMILTAIIIRFDIYYFEINVASQPNNIFLYAILIIIILLVMALQILNWESKHVSYEDENKGYFLYGVLFLLCCIFFYFTSVKFDYIFLLLWFSSIFVIVIIYLQKKINLKRKKLLEKETIEYHDLISTNFTINAMICFISLICWNALRMSFFSLAFSVCMSIYMYVFDAVMLSEIKNIIKLNVRLLLLYVNVITMVITTGYQAYRLFQNVDISVFLQRNSFFITRMRLRL